MTLRPHRPTGLLSALIGAALLPATALAQAPAPVSPGAVYGAPGPVPGYGAPGYGQPVPGAPGQPGYGQPVYGQPVYAPSQPVYAPAGQPEYADVIAVRPAMRSVETRQQVCTPAPTYPAQAPAGGGAGGVYGGYSGRDILGTVLGAAAGGVIGHQIGGGRGQDIATVTGAIIGAGVGRNVANRYGNDPAFGGPSASGYSAYGQQTCTERPMAVTEQPDGYDVTYRYRGQLYQTRLPYDPGTRLAVQTSVTPVGR